MDNREKKILLFSSSSPSEKLGSSSVVAGLMEGLGDQVLVLSEIAYVDRKTRAQSQTQKLVYLGTRLPRPARGGRFISWVRWAGLPVLVIRALQKARKHDVAAVIGVYPDALYCLVACVVALIIRRPFFPYMHNAYSENVLAIVRPLSWVIEAAIFSSASSVFVISDGLRRYYESTRPRGAAFKTVVHACKDVPVHLDSLSNACGQRLERGCAPVVVGFLGSVNESNRDSFGRVVESLRCLGDMRFVVISQNARRQFQKNGWDESGVEFLDVSDSALVDELRRCDVIVVPHGFRGRLGWVEYDTIFPTRVVPCLLSGVPVLLHAPEHSFVAQWFRENEVGEVVSDESVSAIADGVRRLASPGWGGSRRLARIRNAVETFSPDRVSQAILLHCTSRND